MKTIGIRGTLFSDTPMFLFKKSTAIPRKGCRATLPSLIKAFFSFAASESGESFVRRGPTTTISGTI